MKTLFLTALVVLGAVLLSPGCGGSDPEEVALQVSRDWANESIREVSEDISGALLGEIPVLGRVAASLIEDQIRENITWDLSATVKGPQNLYDVVAKAITEARIDVPLVVDKTYAVSVDFRLEVDTDVKRVTRSRLDVLSLRVEEK